MPVSTTPRYVPRAEKVRRRCDMGAAAAFQGHDYTPEEVEFLRAIDSYKAGNQRPIPTWCEVLEVVHSLGYRKGSR